MADDILQWLETLGLGNYGDVFIANEIDLDAARHLEDGDLKELGLPMGPRKKLIAAVSELTASSKSFVDYVDTVPRRASGQQAERRQLTVMFVDLVGSTVLSRRLDPEDLRDIMRRYQDAVAASITHYGGHVAKYLGDGVLAYFGWPRAYEDQAERAVRAGLDAAAAVREVRIDAGERLAARVGIATGRVVVGDLAGKIGSDTEAVTGETPNLAARLQGIAEPGQVVVGEVTLRLIGQTFRVRDLGGQALKGFDDAVQVWAIAGELMAESRFDAAHRTQLNNIIGRETELQLLYERWRLAERGEGQAVVIDGEAGIGKSRLLQGLLDRIEKSDQTRINYQCSTFHSNSALYPTIQHLDRAAGFAPGDDNAAKLDKLEALLRQAGEERVEDAPLFANLLSLSYEGRYGAFTQPPQQIKELLLQALIRQLLKLAEQRPVLFLVEDAHWIDPTSKLLLEKVIGRLHQTRILLVITHRPEWQPLFGDHKHITAIHLDRLDRAQGAHIVRAIAGDCMSKAVVERIVQRTDGVPLYLEELTKMLVEGGLAIAEADIPATLQASLLARIDQLGPETREIAQVGAVIGREFQHDLVVAVADKSETELDRGLAQLVKSELVFRSDTPSETRYFFKHALVHDAVYGTLLFSRRRQLHARIAKDLARMFPSIMETEPETLAHHFAEAGLLVEAVEYWGHAGERAAGQSANIEASEHFKRALGLLSTTPDDAERRRAELRLQLQLGSVLISLHGWGFGQVGEVYERARELGEKSEDVDAIFRATWGIWIFHMTRSALQKARQLTTELIGHAANSDDTGLAIQAHHAAWTTMFFTAELAPAIEHCEKGIALYDNTAHRDHTFKYGGHDPGVCAYMQGAIMYWLAGWPERADTYNRLGSTLAETFPHRINVAHAHMLSVMYRFMRGEPQLVLQHADQLIDLGGELNLPFQVELGQTWRGWALVKLGDVVNGLQQMGPFKDAPLTGRADFHAPLYLALFAEANAANGDIESALAMVKEALVVIERTGERNWQAELFRLRGVLMLQHGATHLEEAEENLHRSMLIAQELGAKALELRGATSLARLKFSRGDREAARGILRPIYSGFTEGFDTPDLMDAKTLLNELV